MCKNFSIFLIAVACGFFAVNVFGDEVAVKPGLSTPGSLTIHIDGLPDGTKGTVRISPSLSSHSIAIHNTRTLRALPPGNYELYIEATSSEDGTAYIPQDANLRAYVASGLNTEVHVQYAEPGRLVVNVLGIAQGQAWAQLRYPNGSYTPLTRSTTFDKIYPAGYTLQAYSVDVDGVPYDPLLPMQTLSVTSGETSTVDIVYSCSGEVGISDPALEASIRTQIQKQSGPVTCADMQAMTTLDASGNGIASLGGLETAVNLASLDLGENDIQDISPLGSLAHLGYLDLRTNRIADIDALAPLADLSYLHLGANYFSGIGALSAMTKLDTLSLALTDVNDIAVLVANPGLAGESDAIDLTWACELDPDLDSDDAQNIETLRARGVAVAYDRYACMLDGTLQVFATGLEETGISAMVQIEGAAYGFSTVLYGDGSVSVPPDTYKVVGMTVTDGYFICYGTQASAVVESEQTSSVWIDYSCTSIMP